MGRAYLVCWRKKMTCTLMVSLTLHELMLVELRVYLVSRLLYPKVVCGCGLLAMSTVVIRLRLCCAGLGMGTV